MRGAFAAGSAPRKSSGAKTSLTSSIAGDSPFAKTSKAKSRWKTSGLKAANKSFVNRAVNSTDPQVLRLAGMTSFKTNNFDEARKHLQKVVDITDDEWIAKKLYLKKKEYVDAELLRALALSHYNVAATNSVKEHFDHNTNVPIFQAAQKVFAPALRHMENAADPDLLLQAGKCYEGLADWNGALTIYGSIIAGFPRYKGMTSVVIRAVALLAQTGQMATAAAYCERILDLPPPGFTQDDMMFVLARTYELAGRNSEAQDTYKEVHRLYNKKQLLLKQRRHQRSQKGLEPIEPEKDVELLAWFKEDKEGPTLDCVNYGEFRAWRSWYDNPETWRRRMKKFNGVLDLPIFAADANVEILRREQQTGSATTATWLSLSYIKQRMRDPTVSLQAAVKALELDQYDKAIRQLVVEKDPDGWGEKFKLEERKALDIQRVLCRGVRGRWRAFRKRNEIAMMNHSATAVQRLRRGQLGRRTVVMVRQQIQASIRIQTMCRKRLALNKVKQLKMKHKAAKSIQKKIRLKLKRNASVIQIQRIGRGLLGKCKAMHRKKCIYGAIKMQGLFRSYKWRKIAREIRIARDAAINIERVFRGSVARTFFRYIHGRFVGARGVQRIGRGWRIRRRIRNLKSSSAVQIQKLIRGHFGRNRVATLRSAVRKHLLHTPVVQLMRAASAAPDCSWLSQNIFKDIHYLNDAFASETVVSETSSLTPKDAKRIGAMLYKNNFVKTLILSSGSMGDEGTIGLASALQYNTSLHTLAIGPNDIGPVGAAALASTLKNHNYSLRHLCLDYNPLNTLGANTILGACSDFFCRNYGKLQRLTLSGCGINDECKQLLGDLLHMNRKLLYLDLSGNKIADVAVKDISHALCNNSTLIGLDLRGNMIRSEGAQALAACLRGRHHDEVEKDEESEMYNGHCAGNGTLQILRLDCNIILDGGAISLLKSFEVSGSLRALTMNGNPIGNVVLERFVGIGSRRHEDPLSPGGVVTDEVGSKRMKVGRGGGAGAGGGGGSGGGSGGGRDGWGGGLRDKADRRYITNLNMTPTKSLPKLKLSPVRFRGGGVREHPTKPEVPLYHSNGTKFDVMLREANPTVGRASFQLERNQGPLSLDNIIPLEMRHAYVSLDGQDGALLLSAPFCAATHGPVTYPSPSVPNRLYRRRGGPVRIAPRHTAKPLPNVFLALVSPPAMHVNPIHDVDHNIIQRDRRYVGSRSGIKSQPRNVYGGPRW